MPLTGGISFASAASRQPNRLIGVLQPRASISTMSVIWDARGYKSTVVVYLDPVAVVIAQAVSVHIAPDSACQRLS